MTSIQPSEQGGYGRLSGARRAGNASASKHVRTKAISAPQDIQNSDSGARGKHGGALSVDVENAKKADQQSRQGQKGRQRDGASFYRYRQLNELPYRQRKAAMMYQENQLAAHAHEAKRGGVELVDTTIDLHV